MVKAAAIRKSVLVLLCFIWIVGFEPSQLNQAFACSGGPGTASLIDVIDRAQIAVEGEFVELDDALNGVFRVKSYLTGEAGPEYLLLALNPPAKVESSKQGRVLPSYECSTAPTMRLHEQAIVFLDRNFDGSYSWLGYGSGFYPFETDQTVLPIFYDIQNDPNPFVTRDFTMNELLDEIEQVSQQSQMPPALNQPYPRIAPLLITTENNIDYLLPVDSKQAVPLTSEQSIEYRRSSACNESPCNAYSPNGVDQISLVTQESEVINRASFMVGNAILFSPTSDTAAVWQENSLSIFAFYYPRLGFEYFGQPQRLNSVDLEQTESLVSGQAAWSPDGRLLAYSDAQGLWLWDVFTLSASPRLLVETIDDTIPYARYFSPLGRYLAVIQGNERYNMDLVNGVRWPDGLVSPDDRTLLAFDTAAEGEFTVSVQ